VVESAPVPPPRRARFAVRLVIAVYLAVATLFCGLLVVGVGADLWRMRPLEEGAPQPVAACVAAAEQLRGELLARLSTLPTAAVASEEVDAFQRWSVVYRSRALEARARCSPPAGASPVQVDAVRGAFDAVVRLLDQSEVQAAHWARHVGPALDRAAAAVERARSISR
jgi:hypothetical protein